MNIRVLVVAPAGMSENSADGFAPRYVAFVEALRHAGQICGVFEVPLPPSPDARGGVMARLRRRMGLHRGRLPRFSLPFDRQALERTVAELEPDLVVVLAPYLAHIALAVESRFPVVVALEECLERSIDYEQSHVSGPEAWLLRAQLQRRAARLYRALDSRAALLVFISDEELGHFRRAVGAPEADIQVVPHGIDTERYRPNPASLSRYDVVVFGRLASARNAPDAVATYRASRDLPGGDRLRWAFVGPLPHASIKALADVHVDVVGDVPDVRPYVQSARMVLCPSGHTTGVKTTLLQALAMGVPVIAHVASTTGLAPGYERAIAVGSDTDEMARRLVMLASDPSNSEDLAHFGVEFVRAHHNIHASAEQFARRVVTAVRRDEQP